MLAFLALLAVLVGLPACTAPPFVLVPTDGMRPVVATDTVPRPAYTDAVASDVLVREGTRRVVGRQAMVVAGHPEATRIGTAVFQRGGNAVDAAVATGFALAVALPRAGNLGGGGFLVIRFPDGTATTVDFRETAPAAATRTMYLDSLGQYVSERSKRGALAVAVPGTVAGLLLAHARYGRLPLADLLDPSIALAETGFVLADRQARRLNLFRSRFAAFPSTARYFNRADGRPWEAGDTLRQADLGRTLRAIQKDGTDGFYAGPVADSLVAEMQRSGGILTHADLAAYRALERPPLVFTYRGHRVVTMPPPSGGGVVLGQLLRSVEPFDVRAMGWGSEAFVHLSSEALRRAFADRACHLGDPAFMRLAPEALIERTYVQGRMASFRADTVISSSVIACGNPILIADSPETTHYSVLGPDGTAVSVTYTINDTYGSLLAVGGAGFLLNNEMDDFVTAPGLLNSAGFVGSVVNEIAPGKRILSSMTPTIVEDPSGRVVLVVGSPGGATIIPTVYQTITGVLDFGLPLEVVTASPRFNHLWRPDVLRVEEESFPPETLAALAHRGWTLEPVTAYGAVDAIQIRYSPGGIPTIIGVPDPRREGTAAGF